MDRAVTVTVVSRREPARDVVELRLTATAGGPLPTWEPGAHVDLVLASGLVRQYSLCGPTDADEYTIAVLRENQSRGGSLEVHEQVGAGDQLMIRGPRNHFPLVTAPHLLLVAGGIGITPLLAMARRLTETGASWELHYGGRTRASMAYLDVLAELAGRAGAPFTVYPQDEVGLLPLGAVLDAAPAGTAVYTCGPEPLLLAVEDAARARDLAVHLERFGPSSVTAAPAGDDTEFEVTLQRSARTLTVPVGKRLIDVVREVVPAVPFSCEEGYCGSCETGVLDGIPDHRDSVLGQDERAANDCMMICVGRSKTPSLVLDL